MKKFLLVCAVVLSCKPLHASGYCANGPNGEITTQVNNFSTSRLDCITAITTTTLSTADVLTRSSAAVSYLGISSAPSVVGTTMQFLYTNTLDTFNVTGDGTTFYMLWNQKVFDPNNLISGNSTFTATVGGKYLFVVNMNLMGIDACCMRAKILTMYTTKRNYQYYYDKINPHVNFPMNLTIITDMDIGDQAWVSIMVNNGGTEVDIPGDPSWVNWSGALLSGSGGGGGSGGGSGAFAVASSSNILSSSISTINYTSDMNVAVTGGTASISINGNLYPTFSTMSASYLGISSVPWTANGYLTSTTGLTLSSAAVSYLGRSSTPWTSNGYLVFSDSVNFNNSLTQLSTFTAFVSSISISYLGISSTPWTSTTLSLSSATQTYVQYSSAAVSYLAISSAVLPGVIYSSVSVSYVGISSLTSANNVLTLSSAALSYLGISSTPWTSTMLSLSSATQNYPQFSSAAVSYLAISSAISPSVIYSSMSVSYLGISSTPWTSTTLSLSSAIATYPQFSSAAVSYVGISSLTSANNVLTLSSAAVSYLGISSTPWTSSMLSLSSAIATYPQFSSAAVSYLAIGSAPATANLYLTYSSAAVSYTAISTDNLKITYSSAAVSYVGISSLTSVNNVLTLSSASVSYLGISSGTSAPDSLTKSSASVSYFGISSNTFNTLNVSSMTGANNFISTAAFFGVIYSSASLSYSTATVVLSTTANNYLPGDRPICYASATVGNVYVTGFGNTAPGKTFTFFNISTQPISLINKSTFSATGNQILTDNGVNVTLSSGGCRTLVYDDRVLNWRIINGNYTDTSSLRLYDATVSTLSNVYMQNASSNTIIWKQAVPSTNSGSNSPGLNLIVATNSFNVSDAFGLPNESGANKIRNYARVAISTNDVQFLFQNDNLSPNGIDLYGMDMNGFNVYVGRGFNFWNTVGLGVNQFLTNASQSGTSAYFWPNGVGSSGQFLQTDGVNSLSWVAPSSACVVNVDTVTSSVVFTTAPGLGFPVSANTNYRFHFVLFSSAAATTTGTGYTMIYPGNTGTFNSAYQINFTTGVFAVGVSTYNSPAAFEHTSAGTVVMPAYIDGYFSNGPNAGNMQVQFRSGVTGSGVTLKKGSYGEIWKSY